MCVGKVCVRRAHEQKDGVHHDAGGLSDRSGVKVLFLTSARQTAAVCSHLCLCLVFEANSSRAIQAKPNELIDVASRVMTSWFTVLAHNQCCVVDWHTARRPCQSSCNSIVQSLNVQLLTDNRSQSHGALAQSSLHHVVD